MVKSYSIFFTFLLAFSAVCSAANNPSDAIIPNASYMTTGNGRSRFDGGTNSNEVRFYTATGKLLETITLNKTVDGDDFIKLNYKLDPRAPKSQPGSCRIAYWPGIAYYDGGKVIKRVRGRDFIYFYDIHGNCICDGRYAQGEELILFMPSNSEGLTVSDFDLSKVQASFAYQELRNDFKHQLFAKQNSLMKEYEKYEAFIEPCLVEAERCLKALKYCKQNAATALAKIYTACLLNYNVACIHQYAMPNKSTQKALRLAQTELMNVITKIQSAGQVENFDAQQELKNTAQLFRRANKAFYKKLPYRLRVVAFFAKYF